MTAVLESGEAQPTDSARSARRNWLALSVVCTAVLMIVLDSTVINIALPAIRNDLHFSETSLVWVVNGFLLPFGGVLLLGGRLGDIFGGRKLFLSGVFLFTVASAVCGLANTGSLLIAARAVQGVGGAVVVSTTLSLVISLFARPDERAKAVGVYSFVSGAAAALGVVAGGVILTRLSWHWIFLVNIPIGIGVYAGSRTLLAKEHSPSRSEKLDVAGAITVTASLLWGVYAVLNADQAGWHSFQTSGSLAGATILFLVFLCIESRVKAPLVPLKLFRSHKLVVANLVGILWVPAIYSWFFSVALYLQRVLHYDPMKVSLAFLPENIAMSAVSLGLSGWIVNKMGLRIPATAGLVLCVLAQLLLVIAPDDAGLWNVILPATVGFGLGMGLAYNPLLLTATRDFSAHQGGLASGIINTSLKMGGAFGLAVLSSAAATQTASLIHTGADTHHALLEGYRLAFGLGAGCTLVAAALSALGFPGKGTLEKPL